MPATNGMTSPHTFHGSLSYYRNDIFLDQDGYIELALY